MNFPGGSDGKESACNVGDLGLIPGLGRSPGGGHGNPLQYSCLENHVDRGAWWVFKFYFSNLLRIIQSLIVLYLHESYDHICIKLRHSKIFKRLFEHTLTEIGNVSAFEYAM